MKKFKHWLYRTFLPTWCKENLLRENAALQAKIDAQAHEIERLKAMLHGIQFGLRYVKRRENN